jgi:hypothetical protein
MRCDLCKAISIGKTLGEENRTYDELKIHPYYHGYLHHRSFTALRLSAQAGCNLCVMFYRELMLASDITKIIQLEQEGILYQVRVRSDIFYPGLITSNEYKWAYYLTVVLHAKEPSKETSNEVLDDSQRNQNENSDESTSAQEKDFCESVLVRFQIYTEHGDCVLPNVT